MKKQNFLTLLARRWSGEISPEEEKELTQAIGQDENFKQIAIRLTAYFENKKDNHTGVETSEKLKSVWETIDMAEQQSFVPEYDHTEPAVTTFSAIYFLKIAAVFLVVLGFAPITYNLLNSHRSLKFDVVNTASDKRYKTLDDGTEVWLNRGSSIRFNQRFGKEKREIFLEGEAFFDVAKNEEIPLFIHVRNLNIEVKGTAFNVNAYRKRANIEVSLLRGLIEITSDLDKGNRVLLLKPNEKLIAATKDTGSGQVLKVIPIGAEGESQDTKWVQDSLIFKKEKLKDLVSRLEKKYAIKIEIQKEELKDKRFSGSFDAESLKEAIEALRLSYPFTYTVNDKLVIIK